MCGIASEDIFRNAQFFGGESEPRGIAPSGPGNDTRIYRLYNECAFSVSAAAPTSYETAKFGGFQSLIVMISGRHDFMEDRPVCIGKVGRIKGLRVDDCSPLL